MLGSSNNNLESFILLGKNISYSLSDKIHEFIYKNLGLDDKYKYQIIDTGSGSIGRLGSIEDIIKSSNIKGGNLTTPYKGYISSLSLLSYKSYFFYPYSIESGIDWNKSFYPYSIGSSNTFFKKNGNICFCSTDVEGMKRSLMDWGVDLDNDIEDIMILGSGGVVRAIIEYFILYDRFIRKIEKKNIYVFCRNRGISKDIISGSVDENINIKFYSLDNEGVKNWNKESYDRKDRGLLINALLSNVDISFLYPYLKEMRSFYDEFYFMDLNYSYKNDVLCNNRDFCKKEGVRFKDGLDMLVYQALYSECIWLEKDWSRLFILKDKIIEYLDKCR